MPLQVTLELSNPSAVKAAVAAGLGVSIVSRHAIHAELALGQLRVLDVEGFPLDRRWYVVYREDKRLSRAAQAFLEFLVSSAESVLGLQSAPARPRRRAVPGPGGPARRARRRRAPSPASPQMGRTRTELAAPGPRVRATDTSAARARWRWHISQLVTPRARAAGSSTSVDPAAEACGSSANTSAGGVPTPPRS